MNHFTSTGYMIIASIPGRSGNYGSTTSIVGIFNKVKTAEKELALFIEKYNKPFSTYHMRISEHHVKIVPIALNEANEQILSENYE